MAQDRTLVARSSDQLGADHQIGDVRLEQAHGAPIEVGIAEVDLIADHELTAGFEDPSLERRAVVRLAVPERSHLRKTRSELLRDLDRSIAGAVLGEDDLVGP